MITFQGVESLLIINIHFYVMIICVLYKYLASLLEVRSSSTYRLEGSKLLVVYVETESNSSSSWNVYSKFFCCAFECQLNDDTTKQSLVYHIYCYTTIFPTSHNYNSRNSVFLFLVMHTAYIYTCNTTTKAHVDTCILNLNIFQVLILSSPLIFPGNQ